MNEIQPSNVQYILWSDDEEFYDQTVLNKNEFSKVIDEVKLNNDLLPYGNVAYDDGRHNMLMDMLGTTLSQQIRGKALYSTWFIDDNNDLWCRDDTFCDGTNYYLYREFNTDNEMIKLTVKSSLVSEDVNFDSDLIFDNTLSIGDRIIDLLELNKETEIDDEEINHGDVNVNAYDIVYMQMLTDEYYDGVFSHYSFEMDSVAETMLKHTRQWKEWDDRNSNFTSNMNSIDSIKMYLGIAETEMKRDLYNSCFEKDDFEIEFMNKKIFGKEI